MTGIKTLSVTVVQLETGDATAWVTWKSGEGPTEVRESRQFSIGDLPDATDLLMWAQMALALCCDGI